MTIKEKISFYGSLYGLCDRALLDRVSSEYIRLYRKLPLEEAREVLFGQDTDELFAPYLVRHECQLALPA